MNRPLPVTLVGGFLGAGKTSLLHHFISEHQGGHLAVLVEDGAEPALDLKAIRGLCGAMGRMHDTVIEISDAQGFPAILNDLARDGSFERVLVEVAGTTNPARFAAEKFSSAVEISEIIGVVDTLDFHRIFVRGVPTPLLDFQRAQIEGATLLVLNKCDLVSDAERIACIEALAKINPTAGWLETAYGELPREVWSRQRTPRQASFQSDVAENPKLSRAVYRAHRPFHPARFWEWFQAGHPGLLRVKGLTWLATRNLLVGGISRTRWQSGCGGAGIWWDALPREEWPSDSVALARMQETWQEPYGDRRQELVLIGEGEALRQAGPELNACLLSDEEFARTAKEWLTFPDPFPAWDVGEES